MPRPPAHAMALVDQKSKASDTFVLRRGDYKNRGPEVAPAAAGRDPGRQTRRLVHGRRDRPDRRQDRPPRGAGALAGPPRQSADGPGDRQPALAVSLRPGDRRHARATSASAASRPAHPELLDWLASELIAGGWRLKPIHRLMVTSAAYRQSSRANRELAADDPENTLLGRMNRRRLDAEGVRDAMLAVSGELNPKVGGPGVLAPLEKEIKDLIFTEAEVVDLWPEDRDPAEHSRRSLYLFRKRNVRYPLFDAFDAPDTQTACPRRETSTHALQALEPAQQRLRRGAGPGPGRPRPPRRYREDSGRDPERSTDCRWPASRGPGRRSRPCPVVPEGPGRADRRGRIRPRPRPGSTSPWRC